MRKVTWVLLLCAVTACERGEPAFDDGDGHGAIPSADSGAAAIAPDQATGPGEATAEPTPTVAALRASLDRLVSGMGGDTATWFSEHTADVLRSVEVDGSGHAIVDFHDLREVIPNASSSAGSALLLGQVNAAVFATPGVESVEYRMNGSCELLGEWLQYGVCLRFDREQ